MLTTKMRDSLGDCSQAPSQKFSLQRQLHLHEQLHEQSGLQLHPQSRRFGLEDGAITGTMGGDEVLDSFDEEPTGYKVGA
jgi:hypothetical protein